MDAYFHHAGILVGCEELESGVLCGVGTTYVPGCRFFLMNLLAHMNVVANDAVPPEQLYASQLSQLQEMGFIDTQENIRALSAVGGNVHAAVERLLGNLG